MSQPADTTTKFSNYKTTPKNMTSIRSKKHIRYQPRTPTPHQKKGGTSALSQHPVSPIHIITTQHTNMLRLKRIEQSTLLSSQTTHHTNNTTTHKHACRDHHQPVNDIATTFWVTTYTTILAFMKKHKLKTLCFISHNSEIHSKSYAFEIVSQMWEINFKSYTV